MPQYDPARKVPLDPAEILPQPTRMAWKVTGEKVTYWLCTDSITPAVLHYVPGMLLGCYRYHGGGKCELCGKGYQCKRAWFVQASLHEGIDAQVELLELTLGALESEPHLLSGDGYLWGRRLTVWRYPGAPTDPMYARLDQSSTPKNLPAVEPTIAILIKRWQAQLRRRAPGRGIRGGNGKSLRGSTETEGGANGK